jgi:hypothetical protein
MSAFRYIALSKDARAGIELQRPSAWSMLHVMVNVLLLHAVQKSRLDTHPQSGSRALGVPAFTSRRRRKGGAPCATATP